MKCRFLFFCFFVLFFLDSRASLKIEKKQLELDNLKKRLKIAYIENFNELVENLNNAWLEKAKELTGKKTEQEIDKIPKEKFQNYLALINLKTRLAQYDLLKNFIAKNITPLSINLENEKGQTILHVVLNLKFIDLINDLLKKGADINAQNIKGNTALHFAIQNNDNESAKTLLKEGANPNIQNREGFTPLHTAVLQLIPSIEIVKILLQNGANPIITTQSIPTPHYPKEKAAEKDSPLEMAEKILKSLKDQLQKIKLPEKIQEQKIAAQRVYEKIIPLMQQYAANFQQKPIVTSQPPTLPTKSLSQQKLRENELTKHLNELTKQLRLLEQKLRFAS